MRDVLLIGPFIEECFAELLTNSKEGLVVLSISFGCLYRELWAETVCRVLLTYAHQQLSLFISDFLQAVGFILSLKWVVKGEVYCSQFCTAQGEISGAFPLLGPKISLCVGAIQQLGETGVAMATLESLNSYSYSMRGGTYELVSGNCRGNISHHFFPEGVTVGRIASCLRRGSLHLAVPHHLCQCRCNKAIFLCSHTVSWSIFQMNS